MRYTAQAASSPVERRFRYMVTVAGPCPPPLIRGHRTLNQPDSFTRNTHTMASPRCVDGN